jgi:hypothetical protein
MISIIISSSNPEYLSAVKKNIDATVGIPYEVIAVPNGDGKRGICEVYNSAGAHAKYDVLCFMHEDVIIHTQGWGKKVLEIMSDPEIGLLGIAGSTYKTLAPGGWACLGLDLRRHKANLLQRYRFSDRGTKRSLHNSANEMMARVAAIDGVWMCTKKDIFSVVKFDEGRFKGFHGYDVDFSLQVALKFKVYVTFEILLEHFSEGNFSSEWLESIFLLHEKHQNHLPLAIESIPGKEIRQGEKYTAKSLMKQLSKEKYSKAAKLRILWRYRFRAALGLKLFVLFHINILLNRY